MIMEDYLSVLEADQTASVLDNAPVAIYVSALDNWELLYANRMARAHFSGQLLKPGLTCYQAAGQDRPCPFCSAEKMSRETLLVRKFRHPQNGRVYELSGKIVDWADRPAQIEYIVDITDREREEERSRSLRAELEETFTSIPCGLCVYQFDGVRISPVFHNPAFYEIMGYSDEHIRDVEQSTDFLGVHPGDADTLRQKIQQAILCNGITHHTYRVFNDRRGEYRWIRLDGSVKEKEDGTKLLYGVYSDVSESVRLEKELTTANEKLEHIVGAIPGGVASYKVEGGRFIPTFYSDGIMALSGHTREEYRDMVQDDVFDIIYEADRDRVHAAACAAVQSGGVLDVSYRMRHKDGSLIWIHLNGQRVGPLSEDIGFYAVFTGISDETRLFQSIANEIADGVYVIDKANYDLLYVNESGALFREEQSCTGQKCYKALYGKDAPCAFCTLKTHAPDGKTHSMDVGEPGRFYSTRFKETNWNGIPSYIKYVQDVTEEVRAQKEKERMEEYFQTVVRNLPGGVIVIRCLEDGRMTPEYISDGFAELSGMPLDEVWRICEKDAMAGVHPEDRVKVNERIAEYIRNDENYCEMVYRLRKGDGSYLWVKNTLSLIQGSGGEKRIYAGYHDITSEREEQEMLRRKYNDLILQHYRRPDPDALIIGHCNVTQNQIIEIMDHTGSDLLKTFGNVRESFFTGISRLVVDPDEQQTFLNTYLNAPSLAAFERNETEVVLKSYIKLPKEAQGRYVKFKVNLVETPDTGDVTGILTVTDITRQTISERMMGKLAVASYDLVAEVDVFGDRYRIISKDDAYSHTPEQEGIYSEWIGDLLNTRVVPKDKAQVARLLDVHTLPDQLREKGDYSFSYSVIGEKGELLFKNMTVSALDMRLGRVCLARTDITDSIREQQGLLNVIAYTFEMIGFIDIDSGRTTMYTRQIVLENLPPYVVEDYTKSAGRIAEFYESEDGQDSARKQFSLDTLCDRLKEKPEGYDFVLPYRVGEEMRYKQINVLWGDRNQKTVCLVRADVTDMLASERRTKAALEKALSLAEKANQAKSDFLSSMSHDIRTPMNAVMGMTTLAAAHLDDTARVRDCLDKIAVASRHLLSLINDILDMSKIERSQITLNHSAIAVSDLLSQLNAMIAPQAADNGLSYSARPKNIRHPYFYGDPLRINQILINLLSNAIKFTPEGGRVELLVEEIPPVKTSGAVRYRFSVSDTGVGMSDAFLIHVFEPFTRGRNVTRVEGTGLGLSITKGLVDLMEGEITAESQEHAGTIFRVELEFAVAQSASEDLEKREDDCSGLSDESLLAGRCFLIAEDNQINSEILSELLKMLGADSRVRVNGAEAVAAFESAAPGTYDAVLMDIQMPEMNGFEATQAIRSLPRPDARTIPIVAMTANAFAEDIQAALDAGMNAHVAKPVDMKVLRATLCRALKNKA